MYRLFYAEGSAACSTRVMLEEIGADYELIETAIEQDRPRDPELLKLNPNGWIPVLVHEDGAMFEASAISIYLADKYPETALAPSLDDPSRGPFLQWLVYFSDTLMIAYQLTHHWKRYCEGPEYRESTQRTSSRRLREIWSMVDSEIGDREWFVGGRFSAVDIHLHMLAGWLLPELGQPSIADFPNAKRIADKVTQRPSVKKVYGL